MTRITFYRWIVQILSVNKCHRGNSASFCQLTNRNHVQMFQQEEGERKREVSSQRRYGASLTLWCIRVRKAGICITGEFFQTHLNRYDELNIGCRKLNPSVYKLELAASEVNSQSVKNMNSLHKRFLSYIISHFTKVFKIEVYH